MVVGTPLYIVPGREGPSVANLPPWPFPPERAVRGEQLSSYEKLTAVDGRIITWGRYLRPRRAYSVEFVVRRGAPLHGDVPPTREALMDFLSTNDLVRWTPPGEDDDRAFGILADVRWDQVDPLWETCTISLVELIWLI